MKPASPLEFFSHLVWIDGRPLMSVIEPYRQKIFMDALYSFDADGALLYNFVLCGRGKKNWKSADLVLACLYRLLVWQSDHGNDCYLIANDEDQAADDLKLAKKLIAANPILDREVVVKQKIIERRDGQGALMILPARDAVGMHGKTYSFCAYDELHGHRNWDVLEAMAPDPSRPDSLQWVTSYASIYNTTGAPLFDLVQQAKRGDDSRMYFSWYAGDFTTDERLQCDTIDPERRANPSLDSWGNPGYLAQQRRRLPLHKYRRLHLNLPGMPDGTYLDAERVMACIASRRKHLKPVDSTNYLAFVDMSGGSSDDAVLAIGHYDKSTERAVLDRLETQAGRPPFNPRDAIIKFAAICKEYRITRVTGDRYAGETFRRDFEEHDIRYETCGLTKQQLYEAFEPALNAAAIALLDIPKLQEQLLGLTLRNRKIDHLPGEHDDLANAAAGAMWLCAQRPTTAGIVWIDLPEESHSPFISDGATPYV